jgi:carbon monoxide dehydrogenase subunit G
MTQRIRRSIVVRRPHDEVAAFVTDPPRLLEAIPGFARFKHLGSAGEPPGAEHWEVFLEIGTLHVGGRVLVLQPSSDRIEWRSDRGTSHSFCMSVEPLGEHSRLTVEMEYHLSGLLMAWAAERLARGIVVRHLEAGLEEVRHLLEYGDHVAPGLTF